jgi:hypothetical protein
MPRNNEDARSGLNRPDMPGFEGTTGALNSFVSKYTRPKGETPDVKDVKSEYDEGKITMEEAHDLNPGLADEKNAQGYATHKLRSEETMSGRMQRSEETARKVHKKAGLKAEGNW